MNFQNYNPMLFETKKPKSLKGEGMSNSTISVTATLDSSTASTITQAAEREIIEEVKKAVRSHIFRKSYYAVSDDDRKLQDWIGKMIKEEFLEPNKDLIIARAAEILADSMRRSKIVREKFSDILEEELK